MTVNEKIRELFGIAFSSDLLDDPDMIECLGMPCCDCPINKLVKGGCAHSGAIGKWLESEYVEKGDEEKESVKKADDKTEYEKGFEDGQAKVFEDLAKIFERK